jgi:LTXXQ motif family protein
MTNRIRMMPKRMIGILATSATLCALLVATDVSAAGRGGGGRGGGGGHPGGGGHASFGGGHFGGGGHAFGGHAFASPAFAGHGLGGHAFAAHRFAPHSFSHGEHLGGHGTRFGAAHNGLSEHNLAAHNNALAAHNHELGAHNELGAHQFAHDRFAHNQISRAQITHNQFAAHNFHGLHNFNRTGFNRNAFGNRAAWNHWGGRFYGAGWNRWGGGWGGWAGPVFWPFLLGDIFSFALWPYGGYDPFWAYGADFFLASIFAPGPYFGPEYGYGPGYYGSGGYYAYAGSAGGSPNIYYGRSAGTPTLTPQDRQELVETNTQAMQSCGSLAPGVSDLPIAQIQGAVHPTADQSAALDELNAAISKASEIVAASCPKDVPLTPVGRLDAAEKRLDGMLQAVQVVRTPLQNFYDSLSDEQRQRFDALGRSGRAEANLTQLCSKQAGGMTDLPIQRIEQVVQPTAEQQDAFNGLKAASAKAAEGLQASCPPQLPTTPLARLDAVGTRLKGMLTAMHAVRPRLQQFYASLGDEQKARFDTMGPPQSASAQQ